MASRNEHTLAPIFSNARSGEAKRNYDDGYDRIFKRRERVDPRLVDTNPAPTDDINPFEQENAS